MFIYKGVLQLISYLFCCTNIFFRSFVHLLYTWAQNMSIILALLNKKQTKYKFQIKRYRLMLLFSFRFPSIVNCNAYTRTVN